MLPSRAVHSDEESRGCEAASHAVGDDSYPTGGENSLAPPLQLPSSMERIDDNQLATVSGGVDLQIAKPDTHQRASFAMKKYHQITFTQLKFSSKLLPA